MDLNLKRKKATKNQYEVLQGNKTGIFLIQREIEYKKYTWDHENHGGIPFSIKKNN